MWNLMYFVYLINCYINAVVNTTVCIMLNVATVDWYRKDNRMNNDYVDFIVFRIMRLPK